MNKLFIYYSLTGAGDAVNFYLQPLGFEARKVEMKKPLPKKFFFRVLVGGYLAMIKDEAELVDYNNDISGYDKVVIGSPVWNDRLSTPINTVLKKTNLENVDLTFVLYSGSGEAKKAEKRIKKEYPNAKLIILKEPRKYNTELNKLNEL